MFKIIVSEDGVCDAFKLEDGLINTVKDLSSPILGVDNYVRVSGLNKYSPDILDMMILGIDYGDKWCGMATSEGSLAEPLKVVALNKIFEEVERLHPEKVVVGISEGTMANKTRTFVHKLQTWVKVPVETVDETLTSLEAKKIKSKDKQKQHAIAAALILQRYLDNI